MLYTYNGGEFLALQYFLATHGVTHLTTSPHTPEHNGYSERQHQHIFETCLTLLYQASIPLIFLLYAFATTVYLINKMPKVSLSLGPSLKSCFTKLLTHPNSVSSIVYAFFICVPILPTNLIPNPVTCVFLGYSLTQSAFLSLDPILKKTFVSRHVKFVENIFLFASPSTSTTPVIDTDSTMSASSFTLSDYPTPPTSSSLPSSR